MASTEPAGFLRWKLIPDLISRHTHPILLIVAAVTLLAILQLVDVTTGRIQIQVDPSAERLLAADDEANKFYQSSRRIFGNDETIVLLLQAEDVFSANNLDIISRLTQRLERLNGVIRVVSLSNALAIRGTDYGIDIEPYADLAADTDQGRREFRQGILSNPMYSGSLVATNARATAILVSLADIGGYAFLSQIDNAIKEIVSEEAQGARIWITGTPALTLATTNALLADLIGIPLIVIMVMAVVLAFCFRCLKGVLVPLSSVAISVLWTLATIAALGYSLNIVTVLVPFGVGPEGATLAKIARELGNEKEAHWRAQAEEVRRCLINKLWVAKRHACFDLDRTGRRLEELVHNNLRCMWYGIFTQQMADAFIKHHLLNSDEFWTPVPLVSIAANESLFRSNRRNDWSGQPQGLTYQRAIGALENYGHYAEVTLLGRKLLPILIRNGCTFTQQLNPFTGEAGGKDGYGPMILATLEYTNRMHGIHLDVERDRDAFDGGLDVFQVLLQGVAGRVAEHAAHQRGHELGAKGLRHRAKAHRQLVRQREGRAVSAVHGLQAGRQWESAVRGDRSPQDCDAAGVAGSR